MSFVKVVKYTCPVCNKSHERNADLVIHKRMRDIKEEPYGGMRLCEEHYKEGFTALISISETSDEMPRLHEGDTYKVYGLVYLRHGTLNDSNDEFGFTNDEFLSLLISKVEDN